jgi:hypothetical protein
MAVTRSGQVVRLPVNGDTLTGRQIVSAMSCSGAVTVKDGSGAVIWEATAADTLHLAEPIGINGIEKDAGAGVLYVYLS